MLLRSNKLIIPISRLVYRLTFMNLKDIHRKEVRYQSTDGEYAYEKMKSLYGGVAMSLKKGEWVPPPYSDSKMTLYTTGTGRQTQNYPVTFTASLARGIKMGLIEAHDPRLKYLYGPTPDTQLVDYLVENLTNVLGSGSRPVQPVAENWFDEWKKEGIFPEV